MNEEATRIAFSFVRLAAFRPLNNKNILNAAKQQKEKNYDVL